MGFGMRVYYAQAVYGEEEIAAVNEVLGNSLSLMNGQKVAAFETAVADLFGKSHALMVNSGSSANTLAVAALGLKPGDEVITPALTFSTTVAPLLQHGLIPVFVDVDPDTYVTNAQRISEAISSKTKAVMIPNLIGNLPDWLEIKSVCEAHGLLSIEDSADTIGSRQNGSPVGANSDIATTSFYASHVVTGAGFGGMTCFNDPELYRKAKQLRGWGRRSSLFDESESIEDRFNAKIDGIEYDEKFIFGDVGFNFLPSELSAAFGLEQLKKLPTYSRVRQENFERLYNFFEQYTDYFALPRQTDGIETNWLAFPIRVRDTAPFSRREMQVHLESLGIQTRTVFTGNILRQPGFKNIPHRAAEESFPNADAVMRGGILLGAHQGMGEKECAYIADSVKALIEKSNSKAAQ